MSFDHESVVNYETKVILRTFDHGAILARNLFVQMIPLWCDCELPQPRRARESLEKDKLSRKQVTMVKRMLWLRQGSLTLTLAMVLSGGSQKHLHIHSSVSGSTFPGSPVSSHRQHGTGLALQTL